MKTYAEKLRDPRWQRKRLEIMERDDFACRYCRSKTETLNVHHRIYRKGKMPWDYEDDVFVTLCEGCHVIAETRKNHILMKMGHSEDLDRRLNFIAGAMLPKKENLHLTLWGRVAESLHKCIHAQYSMINPIVSHTPCDAYWCGMEAFIELHHSITDAQRHFNELYENIDDQDAKEDAFSQFDQLIASAPEDEPDDPLPAQKKKPWVADF